MNQRKQKKTKMEYPMFEGKTSLGTKKSKKSGTCFLQGKQKTSNRFQTATAHYCGAKKMSQF
jgi:hypothetical protein